jgi:voltage-gated potassium channel
LIRLQFVISQAAAAEPGRARTGQAAHPDACAAGRATGVRGRTINMARRARKPSAKAVTATAARPQASGRGGGGRAPGLRARLRELYYGRSRPAVRFRYGLLGFDFVVIIFIIVSSFSYGHPVTEALDLVFGVLILVEFCARIWASRAPLNELIHPLGLVDIIVIVSFLAPLAGENLAFLRVVRALRLFRSYQLVSRLRRDFPFFKRNEDAIFSVVHLCVFLLIATALVFATQHGRNPEISNYADALYFTVTALTTTGFGDITLQGTSGRLLSVLIMIFGVSLFIRLIQTVFRPSKLHYECPHCGLSRHDADAVHCKHCGAVINLPSEGLD